MTGREKQCRRILSLSLQKTTVPSDEVSSKSECENRIKPYSGLKSVDIEVLRKVMMQLKTDMPVLGLAGGH